MIQMTETIKVVEAGINHVIADFDDCIDQFIVSGYDLDEIEIPEVPNNVKPSHIFEARRYYRELVEEVDTFEEGYEHLTKENRANYVALLTQIIDTLQTTRKPNRKPRKAKPKTAKQIVKKIKYMREDKTLKIVSIDPEKIVGSTILWVYNVKLRKLTKYVSQNGQTLSLKGTTIQNMDEKLSMTKNIRKPEVDVPAFAADAKNMIETKFSNIKAKPKVPSGRINKDTLLVRAFK